MSKKKQFSLYIFLDLMGLVWSTYYKSFIKLLKFKSF